MRPRTLLVLCGVAVGCAHAHPVMSGAPSATEGGGAVTTIADVGFSSPENVVYDAAADVYLVANVNGGATARDGNGFVSRVAPDGHVLALRWIAGGGAVTLDAPKGLAIRADTLYVADVGAVRLFDRRTGAPLGARAVPGLLLNDISFGAAGEMYVTDTGPDRSTTPVDTSADLDAIFRIDGSGVSPVVRGLRLDRPDGVVADSTVTFTTFGANRVSRLSPSGVVETVATLPGGQVDGLRRLPDGSLAVTSWGAKSVFRLMAGGELRPELRDVLTPAGVALDPTRNRLVVTSMQGNRVYFVPLR
jgi:sugar lactone lactonase YvrE